MTMDYTGCELIANERSRQIHEEGWTQNHDDDHFEGELVHAAVCYLNPPLGTGWANAAVPVGWPWEPSTWKPRGQVDNLVRAGALIAAEIDRLKRR